MKMTMKEWLRWMKRKYTYKLGDKFVGEYGAPYTVIAVSPSAIVLQLDLTTQVRAVNENIMEQLFTRVSRSGV